MKSKVIITLLFIVAFFNNVMYAQSDSNTVELTKNEKDKIKLEEFYRKEIRDSIDNKKETSFIDKTKEFLNSAFGLWLLSTIGVGLFPYYWKQMKVKEEKEKIIGEKKNKLVLELSNIFGIYKEKLKQKIQYSSGVLGSYSEFYFDSFFYPVADYDKTNPIFPEFKDRQFHSLLFEFKELTNGKYKTEVEEIENNLASIKEYLTLLNTLRKTDTITSTSNEGEQKFNSVLQSKLEPTIQNIGELIKKLKD